MGLTRPYTRGEDPTTILSKRSTPRSSTASTWPCRSSASSAAAITGGRRDGRPVFRTTVGHEHPDRLMVYKDRPWWIKVHRHSGVRFLDLVNGGRSEPSSSKPASALRTCGRPVPDAGADAGTGGGRPCARSTSRCLRQRHRVRAGQAVVARGRSGPEIPRRTARFHRRRNPIARARLLYYRRRTAGMDPTRRARPARGAGCWPAVVNPGGLHHHPVV